jgi:predicted negative regulator of RcsB-dependent stress response
MIRVLIAQEDLDAAQGLLDQAPAGGGFDPILAELRGDIHTARGETAQAEAAYREALAGLVPDSPGRKLLQLKYDDSRTLTAAAEGAAP